MNQFIFAQPQRVAGARVVELGAGLGVTSILLEKMGCCRRVLATDGCPDTVALFQENMRDNACDEAVLVAKELMWGEGAEEEEDVGAYDVILASDVIYEKEAIVPLLNSMEVGTTTIDVMHHAPYIITPTDMRSRSFLSSFPLVP
jgi:predicted nicotinamide N-methyase